jgi:hypothetical protein
MGSLMSNRFRYQAFEGSGWGGDWRWSSHKRTGEAQPEMEGWSGSGFGGLIVPYDTGGGTGRQGGKASDMVGGGFW